MQAAFEPEHVPAFELSASASAAEWKGDLLAVVVGEDGFEVTGDKVGIRSEELRALDASFGGLITEILEAGDFKGKKARVGGRVCLLSITSAATHSRTPAGQRGDAAPGR